MSIGLLGINMPNNLVDAETRGDLLSCLLSGGLSPLLQVAAGVK